MLATIIEHTITTINGNEVVKITLQSIDSPETLDALIWLTEKAMRMARIALRACGFDVDKEDLNYLALQPTRLAGRKVTIKTREYKGRVQAEIVLDAPPTDERMAELQKALRAAGESDLPF